MSNEDVIKRNWYRVVETDNFDGDYPDEKLLGVPAASEENAKKVADLMNDLFCGPEASRYWKVVPADYKLQPGFEP